MAASHDGATDTEQRVGDQEEGFASEDVAGFAVDGLHEGAGETEAGEEVAGVVEGVEGGGDYGVGGEEDGGVGVGDEDADEEDEDYFCDGGVGGRGGLGFLVGGFAGCGSLRGWRDGCGGWWW